MCIRDRHENPSKFRCLVDASLERHFKAIKRLVEHGTYFFDYEMCIRDRPKFDHYEYAVAW